MERESRTSTARGVARAHRFRVALRALSLGALCVGSYVHGADSASAPPVAPRTLSFDELFAPVRSPEEAAAEKMERERALNFFKSLELDDLTVSGFVASRKPDAAHTEQEAADYRTYLGMRYRHNLSESIQMSGHTFYGAGTYDGDNSHISSELGALPDPVRASGQPTGEWFGTDWQLSTHLSDSHALHAGIQYREPLEMDLFQQDRLFGKSSAAQSAQLRRKLDVVARSEVALSRELSLNTGFRYDEDPDAQNISIDPRVEVRYKPLQNATLSALFDQADHAPISRERAYAPSVSVAEASDRIRNYELAYEQSLTERHRLRLSAFRYDVEGLLAQSADSSITPAGSDAEIDATGFEVGMERRTPGGTRTSISYAWQQTTDSIGGASQPGVARHLTKMSVGVPLAANKLSTSFELQYHELAVPTVPGTEDRDLLIGNLTLASGELVRDTNISLAMHNVFDTRDEAPGSQLIPYVPNDGRSVRLDLTRKF